MTFTHTQELKLILENVSNRELSKECRFQAGEDLQEKFPPFWRTSLYADVIRDPDLTDNARWVAMLMLYYVGNNEAVRGFVTFIEDSRIDPALKLSATTLLFSLNAYPEFKNSSGLPRLPLEWVQHGLEQLPGSDETDRREYVIKQLLINLFEEGSE